MTKRLPLVPTIMVLTAVATMIALGIWQLQRKAWKEGLIARYEGAGAIPGDVPFPATTDEREARLYRHSQVDCTAIGQRAAVSGRSASGESGWAHIAQCRLPDGQDTEVAYGWSRNPRPADWKGGPIAGTIAPVGKGVRLIAEEGQAGLQPLAKPDPADIPNNHFAYAVQWFLFAAAALVIYFIALRGRARRMSP